MKPYDLLAARHMIACFILGANVLPVRHGTRRLAAIDACERMGMVLRFNESQKNYTSTLFERATWRRWPKS